MTRRVYLADIANVERIKQGEACEAGTIVIMLSANGGKVEYVNKETTEYAGYASVKIKKGNSVISSFLYYAICAEMPEFLARYKTGINLTFESLVYLKVTLMDIREQLQMMETMRALEQAIENESNAISMAKDIKKYFLKNMFPE